MPSKIIFSNEQIELISKLANEGKTRTEIANSLNVNRSTILRVFKEFDIELKSTAENKKGMQYVWTDNKILLLKKMYISKNYNLLDVATILECSLKTITNKANELNINKVESIEVTEGDVKYFKDNFNIKTIEQMSKERRMKEYGVLKKLFKIGLISKPPKYENRSMPESEEFWNDYINPNMSHTDVGRKYGLNRTTIGKWRKKDFGNNFKVMINTWLHKSDPEIIFEEYLNDLNMTFEYQKNICGWRCDYYLGFNLVIEINGRYWHSLDKSIKRDIRKKEVLESAGYTLIVIWDDELINIEEIKNKIITQYRKAVMHNLPS